MERYIDADKLKSNIRVNLMPNVDIDGTVSVENAERYFINLIDKTSTADVVEVVEIERLLEERDKLLKECKKCGRKHGRTVSKLQKEIERLKCSAKHHGKRVGSLIYHLEHAKSEAYREFAERFNDLLKEYAPYDTFHTYEIKDRIDIVEDELTGGANNEEN